MLVQDARTPAGEKEIVASSGLALWGAFLSVTSVAACVVTTLITLLVTPSAGAVILVLPLLGFLGAGLSALGLRQIGRSGGRLAGRPIAIIGLLVGLVSAILQGAAGLSALGSVFAVKQEVVPLVDALFLARSRGDESALRSAMGENVARHLQTGRVDWFFESARSRLGGYRGAEFDLGVMSESMRRLAASTKNARPGATITTSPKPVRLEFERGAVLAFIMLDDEMIRTQKRAAIDDILIMLPDDSVFALRSQGPARALADRLGLTVLDEPSSGAAGSGIDAGPERGRE